MEEVDFDVPESGYEEEQELEDHDDSVENEEGHSEPEFPEEGESQDDYEPEPKPTKEEKPQKLDIRERLNQVQRERFQALQQAEALRQENELLRKTAEMSAGQAIRQYDENLSRRLEHAKAAKIKALEEGDVQSQVEADTELAMISSEMYQASLAKARNNIQSTQYQQPEPTYQNNSFYGREWVKDNSWFDATSGDYDPWLATEVDKYCRAFEENLHQNGQSHLIMSPDYLNVVSQYANQLMSQRSQLNQKRELNMRQSRTPVSPVRSSSGQNMQRREEIKLTTTEKDMARRLGVDDKTYLQFRLRDERENGDRRNFRRY